MIRRLLLRATLLPPALRSRMAEGLGKSRSSKNIHALIRGLNDENPTVSDASASALTAIGPSAAGELIAALITEPTQARPRIIESLGLIGAAPDAVVPPLTHLLRDPISAVRIAAANALSETGAKAASAVGSLARLVERSDAETTAAAIKALGQIGPASLSCLPILIARLEHDDRNVRAAASQAIGKISDVGRANIDAADCMTPLTELLFHRDFAVREAAAQACAAIGPAAIAVLPALMQQSQDKRVGLRHAIITALTTIAPGHRDIFLTLIALTRDKEWTIREAATRGFIPFGPNAKNAVPRLKILLNDERPRVRQAAIEACAAIGSPARFLVDDVYLRLFDKSEETRHVALNAFHRWAPDLAEFLPTLVQEANSTNAIRRQTAADVLKGFGSHAAIIVPLLAATSGSETIREIVTSLMEQPISSDNSAPLDSLEFSVL